jgi:rhamnosyltransferase
VGANIASMGDGASSPATVRASAVIPVKDGSRYLPAVLEALRRQDVAGGLEIVVLDSGSSDGSVEIARRGGARVLPVAPSAFDHGETRNLGAREAAGSTVLFLSQDAVPVGSDFARRLVSALEQEPRLAGAFARQVPRDDADPLTRRDLASWVAGGAEARTVFVDDAAAFRARPPLERYHLSAFDDVASAIRKEVLLAHPFRSTRFGEDLEWGQRVLDAGYGLAYVPEAVAVHSHERTAVGLLRRNYLGHRLLHRLFGLRTVPDRRRLVAASAAAVAGDLATLVRSGAGAGLCLRAPLQAVAATYGQYRGARDEALGRPYPRWA